MATAVVTTAIWRTWSVRFDAIVLTGVREVLPRPRDAGHLGLPAEHAVRAHLPRDAGHLLGEDAQGVVIKLIVATSPLASTVTFCVSVALRVRGCRHGDLAPGR